MGIEKKKKLKEKRRKKFSKSVAVHGNKNIRKMGLFAACFGTILYINTLHHGYVLDDFSVIKENWVTQKGLDAIPTIWETSYRYGYWNSQGSLYRPMALTLFSLEWAILPDSPSLAHLINILLYALCGFLIFRFLSDILNRHHPAIPFITTLLFMAHPLHTEVVANIKSSDELLSFVFSIGSVSYLLKHIRNDERRYLIISLMLFLFAMFSKEGSITFLIYIPLILWYFKDVTLKRSLSLGVLYLIPVFIYFIVRNAVLGTMVSPGAVSVMDNMLTGIHNSVERFATEIALLGKYMWMAVFPHPLVCDYSIRQISSYSFGNREVLITLAILCFVVLFLFKTRKQKNVLSFAMLWYFFGLALYSNIILTIGSHFAERFQFVSSLGFCLLLATLLSKISGKTNKATNAPSFGSLLKHNKIGFSILAVILVLYSYKTVSRNKNWKSDYVLYSHDVKNSPNSARTHYYFGLELMKTKALFAPSEQLKQAYLDSAIAEFSKAASIYKQYADAYDQLGLAYYRKNNYEKAVEYYNIALKYNPKKATTYSNLGAIYFNSKQFEKALQVYKEAIKFNPRYADAYQNMGSTLATLGRIDEAIAAFKNGLQYEPNNPQLNKFLGITYQNMGDKQNADYYLNKARSLGAEIN